MAVSCEPRMNVGIPQNARNLLSSWRATPMVSSRLNANPHVSANWFPAPARLCTGAVCCLSQLAHANDIIYPLANRWSEAQSIQTILTITTCVPRNTFDWNWVRAPTQSGRNARLQATKINILWTDFVTPWYQTVCVIYSSDKIRVHWNVEKVKVCDELEKIKNIWPCALYYVSESRNMYLYLHVYAVQQMYQPIKRCLKSRQPSNPNPFEYKCLLISELWQQPVPRCEYVRTVQCSELQMDVSYTFVGRQNDRYSHRSLSPVQPLTRWKWLICAARGGHQQPFVATSCAFVIHFELGNHKKKPRYDVCCDAVWCSSYVPLFRRNLLPSSAGHNIKMESECTSDRLILSTKLHSVTPHRTQLLQ
jgi:hypothetical protein